MAHFSRRALLTVLATAPLAVLGIRQAHASTTHEVEIKDFKFSPDRLTIQRGDTVRWTNSDSAPHTATAGNGAFDTGALKRGKTGAVTLSGAGSYGYKCRFHPSMTANITVK